MKTTRTAATFKNLNIEQLHSVVGGSPHHPVSVAGSAIITAAVSHKFPFLTPLTAPHSHPHH